MSLKNSVVHFAYYNDKIIFQLRHGKYHNRIIYHIPHMHYNHAGWIKCRYGRLISRATNKPYQNRYTGCQAMSIRSYTFLHRVITARRWSCP